MPIEEAQATAPMTPRAIRRVVTGHDKSGKAVVVADGPSEDIMTINAARVSIADIWQLSKVPTSTNAWEKRDPSAPMAIGPVSGGLNLRVLQFDPSPAEINAEEAFAEMGSVDAHVANARHPGMHQTETVDFGIVISGTLTLLLDEDDVTVSAGDVVIQRGTNHAWENRGDEPCLMAVMVIDASAQGSAH
jgi:mannose-6-phosphate isomerase-like protein (cupin superfamily)